MSAITPGLQALPQQPAGQPAAAASPAELLAQVQNMVGSVTNAYPQLGAVLGGGAQPAAGAQPVAGAPAAAAAGAGALGMQGQGQQVAPTTARLAQALATQMVVRRNTSTLSGGISTLIEMVGKQQTRVSSVSAALAEDAAAQGAMNPAALARLNQESTTASHLSEQARKLQRDLEQSVSTWLRQ